MSAATLVVALVAPAWAGFDVCDSCTHMAFARSGSPAIDDRDHEVPACHEQAAASPKTTNHDIEAPSGCGACVTGCETAQLPPSSIGVSAHPVRPIEMQKANTDWGLVREWLIRSEQPAVMRLDRLLENERPALLFTLFHVHSLLLI